MNVVSRPVTCPLHLFTCQQSFLKYSTTLWSGVEAQNMTRNAAACSIHWRMRTLYRWWVRQ